MRICSWCGVRIGWWRFHFGYGRCSRCEINAPSAPCGYMEHLEDVHLVEQRGWANTSISSAKMNCSAASTEAPICVEDTPPALDRASIETWLDR